MSYVLLRVLFLTAMSVAFCGLTAVLGAAPLVVLRNSEGRRAYLIATVLSSALLIALKSYTFVIPFLISALLVYVFVEGVEMGASLFKSGLLALCFSSGLSILGLVLFARHEATSVVELIRTQIDAAMKTMPQLQATLPVDPQNLLTQLPSALVIAMSLSLWVGTIFGKRFSSFQPESLLAKINLRDFDIPLPTIWFLILATAGTFLPKESSLVQVVAVNVFNFLLFLYFLKGLAIIATYFFVHRVGFLWQGLLYTLFISQLFLLLSVLGLGDVWLNLKGKILKKTTEETVER